MSSITFLNCVPGETNFMKSMKVFSFSAAILKKSRTSIYNFMLNLLNRDFVNVLMIDKMLEQQVFVLCNGGALAKLKSPDLNL